MAFSYTADNNDELSLQLNDTVEIIDEEEEGWFRGRLNGKEGVFPSNFVEELPPETTPSSVEPVAVETREPTSMSFLLRAFL